MTEDGAETDLDLGHYERYLDAPTSQNNNVTTGKIYQTVIEKEKEKETSLEKTVQVIPHITNEIKRRIKILSKQNYDIIITEIGGTVEDIESLPYIETVRPVEVGIGREQFYGDSAFYFTALSGFKWRIENKTIPALRSSVDGKRNYGRCFGL